MKRLLLVAMVVSLAGCDFDKAEAGYCARHPEACAADGGADAGVVCSADTVRCTADAQCCSGQCLQTTCASAATCHGAGQSCADYTDCCDGSCLVDPNIPVGSRYLCNTTAPLANFPDGYACDFHDQCNSGYCAPSGDGRTKMCRQPTTACTSTGGGCSATSQCCADLTCGRLNTVSKCCIPAGGNCANIGTTACCDGNTCHLDSTGRRGTCGP